jgi:hypothetical protein
MNKIKKMALLPVLALLSIGAQAELISTDWKVNNDGLATLDTDSGREWLDLTQTDGMSINQVSALLDTTFHGWRLPTRAEVTSLMTSTFPLRSNDLRSGGNFFYSDTETNNLSVIFQSFFGATSVSTSTDLMRGTYVNDEQSTLGGFDILNAGSLYYKVNSYSVLFNSQSNFTTESNANTSFSSDSFGVYLVSDGGTTLSSINNPSINANANVPLPATLGLLGLAMAGLSFRRKSKK